MPARPVPAAHSPKNSTPTPKRKACMNFPSPDPTGPTSRTPPPQGRQLLEGQGVQDTLTDNPTPPGAPDRHLAYGLLREETTILPFPLYQEGDRKPATSLPPWPVGCSVRMVLHGGVYPHPRNA